MSDQSAKPAAETKGFVAHSPRLAHALGTLHNDVNQLFSRFLATAPFHAPSGTPHLAWLDHGFVAPIVDVTEDDKAFRVAAELPGIDEKDIELSITGDTLVLKGEKKEETEEKGKIVHIFERSYGVFQRSFHIPDNIDREHIAAKYDKGVLVITLPKRTPTTSTANKIAIKIG